MILTQNYNSGKFGPNPKTCSDFYEIWPSQQIRHANYEYNTCQCLDLVCDYWLRVIIGCEIRITVRK